MNTNNYQMNNNQEKEHKQESMSAQRQIGKRFLEKRIIFLWGEVNDDTAKDLALRNVIPYHKFSLTDKTVTAFWTEDIQLPQYGCRPSIARSQNHRRRCFPCRKR